jgi:hypothetical protein
MVEVAEGVKMTEEVVVVVAEVKSEEALARLQWQPEAVVAEEVGIMRDIIQLDIAEAQELQ